jgi:hypothetical protein
MDLGDLMSRKADGRCRVSFRIWHPDIDPAIISRELCLTPTRSWRAGESRRNPNGQLLGGQYDRSYWSVTVEQAPESSELESQLMMFVRTLEPHAHVLHNIHRTGGEIEFFVTLLDRGTIVSHECLRHLVDLNIDLSLDF